MFRVGRALSLINLILIHANNSPEDWRPDDLELEDGSFDEYIASHLMRKLAKMDDINEGIVSKTKKTNVQSSVAKSATKSQTSSEEAVVLRPTWAAAVNPSFIQKFSLFSIDTVEKSSKSKETEVEVPKTELTFEKKSSIRERSIIRMVADDPYKPIPKDLDDLLDMAAYYKDDFQKIPGVRINCEDEISIVDAGADKFWFDDDCEKRCMKYKDCDFYTRDGFAEASWLCSGFNWMDKLQPDPGWQIGLRPDLFVPFEDEESSFVVLRNHQIVCPQTVLSADYSKTKYFEQLVKECANLEHPSKRKCAMVGIRFAASPVGDPRDAERLTPHYIMCASGTENGIRYMEGHIAAVRIVKDKQTRKSPWEIERVGEDSPYAAPIYTAWEREGMVSDVDGIVYNPHIAQMNDYVKQNQAQKDSAELATQKDKIDQVVSQATLLIGQLADDTKKEKKDASKQK